MKCLSTFICCGWAHGRNLKLLCLWRYWLRKLFLLKWGKEVEPNDIVWCHGWGWESLLTASHINIRNMYTKCLAPWYVVGGHMGEPLDCYTLCQGGGPKHGIPHPYDILKESILASCYAVDGHMSPPLHCFTFCAGGSGILRNLGYGWAWVML